MTLSEALVAGFGSAIYTGNKPDLVFVEETDEGGYSVTTTRTDGASQDASATRRLLEVRVNSYDELVLRVTGEPFVCDPFAGWDAMPDL